MYFRKTIRLFRLLDATLVANVCILNEISSIVSTTRLIIAGNFLITDYSHTYLCIHYILSGKI